MPGSTLGPANQAIDQCFHDVPISEYRIGFEAPFVVEPAAV